MWGRRVGLRRSVGKYEANNRGLLSKKATYPDYRHKKMKGEHEFKATRKMYTSRLQKWGFRKNKARNLTSNLTNPNTELERLQAHIALYIRAAFMDKGWEYDEFRVYHGTTQRIDYQFIWQTLSDHAFGTDVLFQRHQALTKGSGKRKKLHGACSASLGQLRSRLLTAFGDHNPFVMVKLWRMIFYLSRICDLVGNDMLLRTFLSDSRSRTGAVLGNQHAIPQIFDVIWRLVRNGDGDGNGMLLHWIKLGYQTSIDCMRKHVGEKYPLTLSMRTNYLQWGKRTNEPSQSQQLTRDLESTLEEAKKQESSTALPILHDLAYHSFYSTSDRRRTEELMGQLLQASGGSEETWSTNTLAFPFASRAKAVLHLRESNVAAAQYFLSQAISRLRRGDSAWKIRAYMLYHQLTQLKRSG
ncbi:Clr5 domain-containing protein [Cladophialophora immunda]|nr:Clr5 domain-containing protein [Cladophialophora immunda]